MATRGANATIWLVGAIAAARALAQDPVAAFPKNYRVVFENSAVKVLRVHYGPQESLGVHDHAKTPTVYVYLNDSGEVRFQHTGPRGYAAVRPAVRKGDFRASPGNVETHSVRNLSATSSEFLRVELKLPLGLFRHPSRGAAPVGELTSLDALEFECDAFQVERVVCLSGATCGLNASPGASLVVALTPLRVAKQKLSSGDVAWLNGTESGTDNTTVTSVSAAPAHLLRIVMAGPAL